MAEVNLETATAYHAWDWHWRNDMDRAEWLVPEPEVMEVIELLRLRGASRVLDLGCGVGRHLVPLARAGFETHGLDGSETGLAHSRRALEEAGLAAVLRLGLMTALPYADRSFDYVLAFNVIYHGDETVVRRTVAEIQRLLHPGGLYQGTMLSKRNINYGCGTEVAPNTWTREGDLDKGHPHSYCNAAGLLSMFAGFEPLSLVDRVHRKPGSWHWHLLAERT
jgi:SAM-dependent methyltransferase